MKTQCRICGTFHTHKENTTFHWSEKQGNGMLVQCFCFKCDKLTLQNLIP